MDREEVKVDKKRKKEQCHYPAILIDQSWSIKDYYVAKRRTFSCGTDAENPECTRWVHLAFLGWPIRTQDSLHLPRSRLGYVPLNGVVIRKLEVSVNKTFTQI